ncbi:MAG: AraC family transcriptional regulator [Intestinibacter bartlettii]|uniref:helix-turn-helix transcriptional regulator n=1 Tax=Intestinibacter bartlettii TaxID=261299 RepID=UPI0026F02D0C|nr:AraC family transcriptional regulator [Intestinibacter bartlettii]MDO5009403.1 AraC family transcriptional regulator [Intestinibacter bartlettii]
MNLITSTLNDFYHCCKIPVKAISYELDEIYKIGYNEDFEILFPLNDIRNLVHNEHDYLNHNIKVSENIYYKVMHISKLNKYKGFFVLGPISIQKHNENNNFMTYLPLECFNYCSNLLIGIATDKFNKTMDNKSFNPYIKKAIEYVHKHYDKNISITALCQHLNLNKSYFCSTFKTATGHTFCHFLNHFRVEKSKKLLLETDLNILDIALAVGFNNQNYYSTIFKKFTGKTPFQYRICNKH